VYLAGWQWSVENISRFPEDGLPRLHGMRGLEEPMAIFGSAFHEALLVSRVV